MPLLTQRRLPPPLSSPPPPPPPLPPPPPPTPRPIALLLPPTPLLLLLPRTYNTVGEFLDHSVFKGKLVHGFLNGAASRTVLVRHRGNTRPHADTATASA